MGTGRMYLCPSLVLYFSISYPSPHIAPGLVFEVSVGVLVFIPGLRSKLSS